MQGNLDKKAWLRIVEAFIGIIMITGVVLTMMSRPAVTDVSVQQETVKLEKFILDRVVADPLLRSQILSGDVSEFVIIMRFVLVECLLNAMFTAKKLWLAVI